MPIKSLIPYITFADPSIEFTEQAIAICFENGADAIEIGVPFSDPIADGPVIQKSHQRALEYNPDLSFTAIFKSVLKLKKKYSKPILLMSAVNLILHWGIDDFFKEANQHKVDGIVIPDLSVEEAQAYLIAGKKYNIDVALLISPLCSPHRLKKIVNQTQGFLYLISSTGLTGERNAFAKNLTKMATEIHSQRKIPIWVGFGISKPEHVQSVCQFAQGAIVGSHIVNLLAEHHHSSQALDLLGKTIKALKGS